MTVAWRVAKSLLVLRDQLKAAHPTMSNIGFIGDAEHASRESDHNPWIDDPASSVNVVSAGDVYHQPAKGMDAGKLAEALKQAKDPRVKYVIWNRRIWSLARNGEGWRPYTGKDPHTGHVHISVSSTKSLYDNTRPWTITIGTTQPPQEDDEMSPEQLEELKNHIDASTNASARRWALWLARYEVQTEDEKAKARDAYDAALKAGKSPTEAQAAFIAVLQPLDDQLAKDQAKK